MQKRLGLLLLAVPAIVSLLRSFFDVKLPIYVSLAGIVAGVLLIGIAAYKNNSKKKFNIVLLSYSAIAALLIILQLFSK